MHAIPLAQAALELGVQPATLRRWLREGCPCVSPGSAGRGRGAMVDVEAVRRWRAGDSGIGQHHDAQLLERVASALWDTLARDGGEGVPLHRTLGVTPAQAAGLLAEAFERIARAVTGRDAGQLPVQIERIRTVFVCSRRSNSGDASK